MEGTIYTPLFDESFFNKDNFVLLGQTNEWLQGIIDFFTVNHRMMTAEEFENVLESIDEMSSHHDVLAYCFMLLISSCVVNSRLFYEVAKTVEDKPEDRGVYGYL